MAIDYVRAQGGPESGLDHDLVRIVRFVEEERQHARPPVDAVVTLRAVEFPQCFHISSVIVGDFHAQRADRVTQRVIEEQEAEFLVGGRNQCLAHQHGSIAILQLN